MEVLTYRIDHKGDMSIFEFELARSLEPQDLKTMVLPDIVKEGMASKAVVISGRGPVWLYGFFVHYFHVCRTVAVYDPRLGGGVVVESHSNSYAVGDVLKLT